MHEAHRLSIRLCMFHQLEMNLQGGLYRTVTPTLAGRVGRKSHSFIGVPRIQYLVL